MPTRTTKKQRAEDAAQAKKDFNARRDRVAGPEGLSPDLGRGGTPCHFNKDGHHWETCATGQRQYLDTEAFHIDPFAPVGHREFRCRLHLETNNAPPPAQEVIDVEHGHRDPMFNTPKNNIRASPRSHVDIDLTQSPRPPAPAYSVQPAPGVEFEAKPSHVKIWFHVFSPIPKTKAETQSGATQKYSDYTTVEPFDATIQVHGAHLIDIRDSIFDACDAHKTVCGAILKESFEEGHVQFKGYVAGRGDFLKSAMKTIATEEILDKFKETMIKNKDSEVGFRLNMDNPKTVRRLKSKEDEFDRSTSKTHPNSLTPARVSELEMLGINVQPDWQKARVGLMRRFGCVSIGGRECMGCINPANTKEAVYLSHAMMDTWAQDAVMHKHGATELLPPTGRTEFRWIPIHPKPGRRSEYAADAVQSTSQIADNRPESPAPLPLPEFEDYLKWAKISPDDQATRDLLIRYNIIDFEAFLSPSMDVPTLERLGFAIGTAVRLHDSAPSYRTDLKVRKAMQVAYLDEMKDK